MEGPPVRRRIVPCCALQHREEAGVTAIHVIEWSSCLTRALPRSNMSMECCTPLCPPVLQTLDRAAGHEWPPLHSSPEVEAHPTRYSDQYSALHSGQEMRVLNRGSSLFTTNLLIRYMKMGFVNWTTTLMLALTCHYLSQLLHRLGYEWSFYPHKLFMIKLHLTGVRELEVVQKRVWPCKCSL